MQGNRQNLKWAKMTLILLVACLADLLVGVFVHRPLPWVVFISALITLLGALLVTIPMIKAEKN
jgi:hypothetical membrane protein